MWRLVIKYFHLNAFPKETVFGALLVWASQNTNVKKMQNKTRNISVLRCNSISSKAPLNLLLSHRLGIVSDFHLLKLKRWEFLKVWDHINLSNGRGKKGQKKPGQRARNHKKKGVLSSSGGWVGLGWKKYQKKDQLCDMVFILSGYLTL